MREQLKQTALGLGLLVVMACLALPLLLLALVKGGRWDRRN